MPTHDPIIAWHMSDVWTDRFGNSRPIGWYCDSPHNDEHGYGPFHSEQEAQQHAAAITPNEAERREQQAIEKRYQELRDEVFGKVTSSGDALIELDDMTDVLYHCANQIAAVITAYRKGERLLEQAEALHDAMRRIFERRHQEDMRAIASKEIASAGKGDD